MIKLLIVLKTFVESSNLSPPKERRAKPESEQALTRWGKACVFSMHPACLQMILIYHRFEDASFISS